MVDVKDGMMMVGSNQKATGAQKGLQAIDDQATAKKERKHQDCAGAALQG